MKKYRIDLVQTVVEGCTLFVDADDQEAAKKMAEAHAYSDKDQNGEPVIWKFVDFVDAVEIIGCAEWPHEREGETA